MQLGPFVLSSLFVRYATRRFCSRRITPISHGSPSVHNLQPQFGKLLETDAAQFRMAGFNHPPLDQKVDRALVQFPALQYAIPPTPLGGQLGRRRRSVQRQDDRSAGLGQSQQFVQLLDHEHEGVGGRVRPPHGNVQQLVGIYQHMIEAFAVLLVGRCALAALWDGHNGRRECLLEPPPKSLDAVQCRRRRRRLLSYSAFRDSSG